MPNTNNSLIIVDGVVMPQPYAYTWLIQDVSLSSAGRTEDALMHKERVARKRKLQLGWRIKSPEVASTILKAFAPEYITVRYWDVEDNQYEYRTFYTGDKQAPVKMWTVGKKIIETISFDIIER